ncbi:MAG: FecR domain-containing protein, partial [Planctomycetota bacterium]
MAYLSGTVSFSPAGQPDWVRAAINRPLTTGDRLWTDANSRAELQIGGAAIRMGPSTSLVLLNLDDRIAQVQLSQGTLRVRVRSVGSRQVLEVATPNLAFTVRRIGNYRIEVDPNDDATAVSVQDGVAEVYGQGASYSVDPRRGYRFYGSDLSDYESLMAQRDDDLDRWSRERERRVERSVSARYVSYEVVGYEDLDANGTWRVDANYGNVWLPNRVASGWTPYRD